MLPTFVRQVKLSPLTPVLGDGTIRLQPIWIDDVASFFAQAVDASGAAGRTFEIGGPDAVTWNELYDRLKRVLGVRRRHGPSAVRASSAPWPSSRSGFPARPSPATS